MNRDKSLHKGKFVDLRLKEGDGYKYEYLHEHRCDGQIVAILPVSFHRGILIRQEYTPCWGDSLNISCITGGWEKSKHDTPIDTVLEELREEAGIVLTDEDCIMNLGTCRGTKSSDSVYHLFAVDLSDETCWYEVDIETDGSALEAKAHNEWWPHPDFTNSSWIANAQDPMLFATYTRWSFGIIDTDRNVRKRYN